MGLVYRAVSVYLRNPSLMGYYSFNRPRRDGWLSWPCWLTNSGRFTHTVVTQLTVNLAQDRKSSPDKTGGLTTMLRHHKCTYKCVFWGEGELLTVELLHSSATYFFSIKCIIRPTASITFSHQSRR